MSSRARPAVIVETPPTPNGDLHVGHLAGPFLAADIHARYLRAQGRPVVFTTGTDDSQTYVMATARRSQTTPEDLASRSREAIGRTLEMAGISVDAYAPYDDRYRSTVLEFLSDLYKHGKLERTTARFPYCERTSEFLVEGLVVGYCPVCVSQSHGGVCEMCGHPNSFDELIAPRSTIDPDAPVTYREAQVLVLPMERYRKDLTAFYAARGAHVRPRTAQFIREALSRPLPDFPVTYPISYGLPSPFPGTEGQAINAWVEGIPAVMYCTSCGTNGADGRNLWLTDNDAEIIYFIGSDIVYFWGLSHLALLMAHEGRYALPDMIVSNEFYELENEKFSTSRGHTIYLGELLKEFPRDVVRFHLSLTGPEHQRTNFSREALAKISRDRLIGPWNRIASALNSAGAVGAKLPVSDGARTRAKSMLSRFATLYELTAYSPSGAADLVLAQLDRLDAAVNDRAHGDLFLEMRALIAGASPILIDLAEQARRNGAWDGTFDHASADTPTVRPFRVPVFEGTLNELVE